MQPIAQGMDEALRRSATEVKRQTVDDLFTANPARAATFQCTGAGITLDYSKQLLAEEHLDQLLELANDASLSAAYSDLVNGAEVNITEQRPALHTLLRGTAASVSPAKHKAVNATLASMRHLVGEVHDGRRKGFSGLTFTDVVNIGIGGSDLGPRMVSRALRTATPKLRAHFVANVDPQDLQEILTSLNPASTLFIVCSKSFTTEETLSNALRAREWLLSGGATPAAIREHVVAVTTNVEAAEQFGIDPTQCFPLWDWVGGRYSVWSAIGLVIALQLGWTAFAALLEGARAMDAHTLETPPHSNLPIIMALLEWWNTLYLKTETHLVLPYSQRLSAFTEFLQQLTMESNGKRTQLDGTTSQHPTAPVVWGSSGTIGQHSYYQCLHQGNRGFSADLILPLTNGEVDHVAHRKLAANALAQSRAFMIGRSEAQAQALAKARSQDELMAAHYVMPGNHPHSVITFHGVSPHYLGALIAAYEHKTFFLSRLFNINAFDQWGVELGKVIGQHIDKILESGQDIESLDPATANLVSAWRALNP